MLVLFGAYKGTVRARWIPLGQPLLLQRPRGQDHAGRTARAKAPAAGAAAKKGQPSRTAKKFPRYKVSVRARTLNGPS